MPKVTDDFVVERFFEVFALLPMAERKAIITGLRATTAVMRAQRPEPAQMPLLDEAPQPPDSEDD